MVFPPILTLLLFGRLFPSLTISMPNFQSIPFSTSANHEFFLCISRLFSWSLHQFIFKFYVNSISHIQSHRKIANLISYSCQTERRWLLQVYKLFEDHRKLLLKFFGKKFILKFYLPKWRKFDLLTVLEMKFGFRLEDIGQILKHPLIWELLLALTKDLLLP